jgi:phage baseplate assembly protein W
MSGSVLSGPVPPFQKTIRGYRAVAILVGDTLERIAERELGDAAQWYDLATLNALAPPWVTDDPAKAIPGKVLLAAQDTLLVPTSAPVATGVADAPDVFGTDCLLVAGQITGSPIGDVLTVSGPDNLKQALELRLGTRPRELVYHPDYGNRAYLLVGRGNTPLNEQLAASWVAASIRADPRVSSASDVKATTTGDVLAATGIAIAINGKRLPIGLPGTGA